VRAGSDEGIVARAYDAGTDEPRRVRSGNGCCKQITAQGTGKIERRDR